MSPSIHSALPVPHALSCPCNDTYGERRLSANAMAIQAIEKTVKNLVLTVQDYSLFAWRAFTNLYRPPIYWSEFLIQADIIGFGSLSIVVLTGLSTGGVLALQ